MSHTIVRKTISSVEDAKWSITNGHWSGVIGTSWSRVRIAMLFSLVDIGSAPTSPNLAFGLIASPTASNSVLHTTTSHFLGVRCTSALTRTAGPPPYLTGTLFRIKKVGSTVSESASISTIRFSYSDVIRNIWMLEFTRGSPNFTQRISVGTTALTAQTDMTPAILREALEDELVADSAIQNLFYGSPPSASMAVDETTDGSLNAVHIAWNKATPAMEVSAVGYSVFA